MRRGGLESAHLERAPLEIAALRSGGQGTKRSPTLRPRLCRRIRGPRARARWVRGNRVGGRRQPQSSPPPTSAPSGRTLAPVGRTLIVTPSSAAHRAPDVGADSQNPAPGIRPRGTWSGTWQHRSRLRPPLRERALGCTSLSRDDCTSGSVTSRRARASHRRGSCKTRSPGTSIPSKPLALCRLQKHPRGAPMQPGRWVMGGVSEVRAAARSDRRRLPSDDGSPARAIMVATMRAWRRHAAQREESWPGHASPGR